MSFVPDERYMEHFCCHDAERLPSLQLVLRSSEAKSLCLGGTIEENKLSGNVDCIKSGAAVECTSSVAISGSVSAKAETRCTTANDF